MWTASDIRRALAAVARMLNEGERMHPRDTPTYWENVASREHLSKALVHGERAILGIRGEEDDLAAVCARRLMALKRRERDAAAAAALSASVAARRAR